MKNQESKKDAVFQVNFNESNCDIWQNCKPAILVFDRFIYRFSSWQEFLKLFYYLAYKSEYGCNYLDSLTNQYLATIGNKVYAKPITYVGSLITIKGKKVFTNTLHAAYNGVKFSKNNFVSCSDNAVDNLTMVGYVINTLNLKDVALFVSSPDYSKEQINESIKIRVEELTRKDKGKRKKEKSTKYLIAHINAEILTPEEKFYKRIESEFDKKILLGDIVISEEEETYLNSFMTIILKKLDNSGKITTEHPKVFAFGLVRYAMKYYGQKTFWPYFKDEYGVGVKQANQGVINDEFRKIMRKNNKTYDDDAAIKIDNISMHSFVTDKCANQFFDYLFDYWRIDLNRNIENIYGSDGKKYFNLLLDEIKANNDTSVNNIMKHTSLALAHNEKSCRLRIRRFLAMMDDCFWNKTEIPHTGNRFNDLLSNWINLRSDKILKPLPGPRGESLLFHPQLSVSCKSNNFTIKFPHEILKHCSDTEHPYWVISADGLPSLSIEPILFVGRVGKYTDECEIDLPREYLFKKIKLNLLSVERQYASFDFKENNIRFFNEKGVFVDYKKTAYLPAGTLIAYAENDDMPCVLYQDKLITEKIDDLFVCCYNVAKGDIIVFSDKKAISVGEHISEGLIGSIPVEGAKAETDDTKNLTVYNKLPKILFKAKREQLPGTAILVKIDKTNQFFRLGDKYKEFKLEDSLDDVYAYLIDLNDFIKNEGVYSVLINIPNSRSFYSYQFAYLSKLNYHFEGEPYIFKDNGTIVFDSFVPIETNGDWDNVNGSNVLNFNFDVTNRNECCNLVKDRDLDINYLLSGKKIKLKIRIPALFWKYRKTDDWSNKTPADISAKSMPSNLYISGPFNFSSAETHLNIDDRTFSAFGETDIYAKKVKDCDFYEFNLTQLKSWIDYSYDKRSVFITLNGEKYPLMDIICKSTVVSVNLSGDYDNNIICGNFEIKGDSQYTVKVEYKGQILGQDIPVENGYFELETEVQGGEYEVTLYEIIEDDSGFDADSIKLGKYSMVLADVKNLQGLAIYIKNFEDCNRISKPIELSKHYIIRNLQFIGGADDIGDLEIYGLWKFDVNDLSQLNGCFFYYGTLSHYDQQKYEEDFNVLVVFYNRRETSKLILLRECDGEYVEMLFDIKTHTLMKDDAKLDRRQKRERIICLFDDLYDCIAEINSDLPIS